MDGGSSDVDVEPTATSALMLLLFLLSVQGKTWRIKLKKKGREDRELRQGHTDRTG